MPAILDLEKATLKPETLHMHFFCSTDPQNGGFHPDQLISELRGRPGLCSWHVIATWELYSSERITIMSPLERTCRLNASPVRVYIHQFSLLTAHKKLHAITKINVQEANEGPLKSNKLTEYLQNIKMHQGNLDIVLLFNHDEHQWLYARDREMRLKYRETLAEILHSHGIYQRIVLLQKSQAHGYATSKLFKNYSKLTLVKVDREEEERKAAMAGGHGHLPLTRHFPNSITVMTGLKDIDAVPDSRLPPTDFRLKESNGNASTKPDISKQNSIDRRSSLIKQSQNKQININSDILHTKHRVTIKPLPEENGEKPKLPDTGSQMTDDNNNSKAINGGCSTSKPVCKENVRGLAKLEMNLEELKDELIGTLDSAIGRKRSSILPRTMSHIGDVVHVGRFLLPSKTNTEHRASSGHLS